MQASDPRNLYKINLVPQANQTLCFTFFPVRPGPIASIFCSSTFLTAHQNIQMVEITISAPSTSSTAPPAQSNMSTDLIRQMHPGHPDASDTEPESTQEFEAAVTNIRKVYFLLTSLEVNVIRLHVWMVNCLLDGFIDITESF